MNLSLLSSSFSLLLSRTWTWVVLQKTLKWVILAFLPLHTSCGIFPPNTLCRRPIRQINCTRHSFCQKFFCQFLAFEDALSYIKDRSIFSFCHTILLGGPWNCQGASNSILFIEHSELFGSEFSSSVSPHGFDLLTIFFFHNNFELLEGGKDVWFLL